MNNLFPKIVVRRNALECEFFYFHFRFPSFEKLKNYRIGMVSNEFLGDCEFMPFCLA